MNSTNTHSNKAFIYAIVAIAMFIVFIVLKKLVGTGTVPSKNYSYISAIVMFLVVLFSFMGFIYNIRGLKEPRSFKKVSSLIVNGVLMVLFVITTIMNAIELFKLNG